MGDLQDSFEQIADPKPFDPRETGFVEISEQGLRQASINVLNYKASNPPQRVSQYYGVDSTDHPLPASFNLNTVHQFQLASRGEQKLSPVDEEFLADAKSLPTEHSKLEALLRHTRKTVEYGYGVDKIPPKNLQNPTDAELWRSIQDLDGWASAEGVSRRSAPDDCDGFAAHTIEMAERLGVRSDQLMIVTGKMGNEDYGYTTHAAATAFLGEKTYLLDPLSSTKPIEMYQGKDNNEARFSFEHDSGITINGTFKPSYLVNKDTVLVREGSAFEQAARPIPLEERVLPPFTKSGITSPGGLSP